MTNALAYFATSTKKKFLRIVSKTCIPCSQMKQRDSFFQDKPSFKSNINVWQSVISKTLCLPWLLIWTISSWKDLPMTNTLAYFATLSVEKEKKVLRIVSKTCIPCSQMKRRDSFFQDKPSFKSNVNAWQSVISKTLFLTWLLGCCMNNNYIL
jgi:hypothetical protein